VRAWRALYRDLSVRAIVVALTAAASLGVVLVPAAVLLAVGVLSWPAAAIVALVVPVVLHRAAVRWLAREP
jgi:hypothetical protein